MTDDEIAEAVERIKDSAYIGAEWCQYHPKYYDGFSGSLTDMDTSHDLSAVFDGERIKAGHCKHADTAGYLQDCANVAPKLIARLETVEAEAKRLREAVDAFRAIYAALNGSADD